mmetsp:Transcript_7680/g.18395  ORF Transcript_7680/g.18395 Transcript_7680/m.18395 type:complete len:665 (-) Transcript_7680:113-2107(-)
MEKSKTHNSDHMKGILRPIPPSREALAGSRPNSVRDSSVAGSYVSDDGSERITPRPFSPDEPTGPQLPEYFKTREEGIRFCFDYVDKDKSGYLDRSEFRTIATKVNPQKNLAEAEEMLVDMDYNRDGIVTWEEFKLAFAKFTEDLSDEQFMLSIRKNVIQDESVQEGYKHPSKSRRYLQRTCINAVLSEGLEELVKQIYLNRTELASGTLWDENGYLSRGFRPFNPLKFLGQYILNQVQKDKERREAFAQQQRKRMELAQMEVDRPFSELTHLGKLKLLWNSLLPGDANNLDSKLPVQEMVRCGKALGFPMAVAEEMLERMGYLEEEEEVDEELEFFEFEKIFARFTEDFLPEEIDAYIMLQLGSQHLPYYNNREKAQMIFAKLDEDRSGELEVSELVLLAKMLDPMADEATIRRAIAYLDTDDSHTVDYREFVTAMTKILEEAKPEDVDAAITKILEIGVDAMDLAVFHMAKEFRAYVTGHASYKLADQLGIRVIMEQLEWEKPFVFVDVRTAEEQAVSRIAGAISLPVTSTSKSKGGWTLKGALASLSEEQKMAMLGGEGEEPPAVVMYDAVGTRASSVASQLSAALGGKVVYNMCGGLIEWYNKGGEVVGPDGSPVDAVHPYRRELVEFLARPSSYTMPAAAAKKSALKKSDKKGKSKSKK